MHDITWTLHSDVLMTRLMLGNRGIKRDECKELGSLLGFFLGFFFGCFSLVCDLSSWGLDQFILGQGSKVRLCRGMVYPYGFRLHQCVQEPGLPGILYQIRMLI